MNWNIIAATGEWAGAVAVVASLLYLARQIKLANRQSRAAARYSFLDAYGTANAVIAATTESSSVFRRGLDDGELSDDERMQFAVQLGQFLNTWSVMYDLHREGELPENQWDLVRSDMLAAFHTPGGSRFWSTLGRSNAPEDFRGFVDDLLERGGPTYQLSPTPPTS